MERQDLFDDFNSLPVEAQRQVASFIASLKRRYKSPSARSTRKTDITKCKFIGMWRDRDDMANSEKWVRDLRQREWRDK